MKSETVDKIVAAAKSWDLEVEAYRGYSGRAMFGRKTDAVTYSRQAVLAAAIGYAAAELMSGNHYDPAVNDGLVEFLDDVKEFRTDNLGLGFIAY